MKTKNLLTVVYCYLLLVICFSHSSKNAGLYSDKLLSFREVNTCTVSPVQTNSLASL